MKNLTLIIILNLYLLNAYSQDIIIDFSGLNTGNPIELSSVFIENETQNTSIVLTEFFELNLTNATVIEINENSDNVNNNNYPNPFSDNTNIEIYSKYSENVEVSIFNISGQLIGSHEFEFVSGTNNLLFTPNSEGIYLISVKGENINLTFKLLCLESSSVNTELTLFSTTNNLKTESLFYNTGDKLKYTGIYNNLKTIITDSPEISTSYTFDFYECTDYNQNHYPIVKIGEQWWMAENLKSINYPNGTALIDGANAGDITNNFTTKYYFSYENISSNVTVFGRLYTWAAIMNGASPTNNNPSGVQGVCPTGWHVPSEIEWDQMRDFLGGWQQMHGKVKSVGTELWYLTNDDATNESGLSVLPGGIRFDDGDFQYKGEQGFFWNTYGDIDMHASSGYTFFNDIPTESYYMYTFNQYSYGQSVRCVKN